MPHTRWGVASLVVGTVLAGISLATSSAQTPPTRTINVSIVSYKFDPSLITMNAGDRITIQLSNDDPDKRAHSMASAFFSTVDYTVTGNAKQGVAKDGWKYILLDAGEKAAVSFVVPANPGQVTFICEQYNHAARGQVGTFVIWPAGYKP